MKLSAESVKIVRKFAKKKKFKLGPALDFLVGYAAKRMKALEAYEKRADRKILIRPFG